MKQNLTASQTQHLALTPQLRQALAILQMSAAELEAEVTSAVESNPLLEWAEDGPSVSADGPDEREQNEAPSQDEPERERSEDDWGETPGELDDWGSGGGGSFDRDEDDDFSDRRIAEESLQDHLRWQLRMTALGPRDQQIGLALVDAIDDDGYLRESVADIARTLLPEVVAEDEILAVLRLVQQFDPMGCGARHLGECLHLQLARIPDPPACLPIALRICDEVIERLPKLGAEGIAREFGCSREEASNAIELLRSLDPRPGAQMGGIASDAYVVPDAVIWRQSGLWRTALSSQGRPKVAIHREYERMAASTKGDDGSYLRGRLQEARWLLRNIEQRGETLLRIVNCLVREQSGFLEFGEQALRPLTLREVAGKLELHESTISRAIARKYVRTPRGTLALRDFFASGIDTGGGEASSTAIQSMIQELIAAENPRKPLSDAALTKKLNDTGIPVARRTVAKYREALQIPASHERVRLG